MNNLNPLVSVIISTYNSGKFIRGRIENLLGQSIFNKSEVIIINSGSQENEEKIISEYLPRYQNLIYLKSESRETIYKAWNKAIKLARGKFITNANTDDRLRNDGLEILSNFLLENPKIALVYADQYISAIPNISFDNIRTKKLQRWNNFQYDRLLEGCLTGPQPMWRSSIHFHDDLWFDENYEVAGDYEFSCKVALAYPLYHIPKVLGIYYLSPDSSNKQFQNKNKTFIETYKIKSEYSFRFFKQLDENHLYEKFSYYSKWTQKNILVFYFWKFWLKIINPDKRLPTREFVFWYLSKIKLFIGDVGDARNIAKKYLRKKRSMLLQEELKNIDELPSSDPFISVIIPTYNRPAFLREAITSLLNQSYKKFEVIIINNGTTDVEDIVNMFSTKISIRLFNSDLHGSVSHAKNIGIKNSAGSYIAFLDDDDWYHIEHLETLISEMQKGEYLFAYTDAVVEFQKEVDGKFKTVKKFIEYSRDFNRNLLLIKDYIFTPCMMINKKCLEIIGLFDENLQTDEDMDLLIRLSKYYKFKHIRKVTCSVRRTNSVKTLTKDWDLMYKNALYLYRKHHQLSRFNFFVRFGQLYYLNLRKRRAEKYKDGSFNYNY